MSYDIYLLQKKPGQDPETTAREYFDNYDPDERLGPPSPETEERKKRFVELLTEMNPDFEVFRPNPKEIAEIHDMTEEEARLQYNYIELSHDDTGIQITLGDVESSLTVPYWHTGDAAAQVVNEIWKYLDMIVSNSDLFIFDPQIDRVLDISNDRPALMEAYAGISEDLPRMIKNAKKKKPWWKFW